MEHKALSAQGENKYNLIFFRALLFGGKENGVAKWGRGVETDA